MPRIELQEALTGLGEGFPDYKREVHRARQIWGYVPEVDESFVFSILICTENPGSYSFTRAPLAVGETAEMIDAHTGLTKIRPEADEDYIIKEFWCNFNQPTRFRMIQEVIGDVSCECFNPAYSTPAWGGFPIGWTRAQVEPITSATNTTVTIENLGSQPAIGKVWLIGFIKEEAYDWY